MGKKRGRPAHWWMKVRLRLKDEPEVKIMAATLGVPVNLIVGCCVDFWGEAKLHCEEVVTESGDVVGVFRVPGLKALPRHQSVTESSPARHHNSTEVYLDAQVGVPGFASAMQSVGWLACDGETLTVPDFDIYLSQASDERALAAKRASAKRERRRESNYGDALSRELELEEEKKEEEEAEAASSCPEAEAASVPEFKKPSREDLDQADPIVLTYPTRGKEKEWHLRESKVHEFRQGFPDLDILDQATKALVWLRNSPAKTKTARGMGRFLYGWLSRCQDSPGGPAGGGLFVAPGGRGPKPMTDTAGMIEAMERKMQDERAGTADDEHPF